MSSNLTLSASCRASVWIDDPSTEGDRMGPEEAGLLDQTLQRAADRLGDLRADVMARFYRRHPEAVAIFETESAGHREKLEGEMVAQTLYCLVTWVERPSEVRIVLQTTVPHHEAALHVPDAMFGAFLDAVLETIANTIPAEAELERALLASVHASLRAEVAHAGASFGACPP